MRTSQRISSAGAGRTTRRSTAANAAEAHRPATTAFQSYDTAGGADGDSAADTNTSGILAGLSGQPNKSSIDGKYGTPGVQPRGPGAGSSRKPSLVTLDTTDNKTSEADEKARIAAAVLKPRTPSSSHLLHSGKPPAASLKERLPIAPQQSPPATPHAHDPNDLQSPVARSMSSGGFANLAPSTPFGQTPRHPSMIHQTPAGGVHSMSSASVDYPSTDVRLYNNEVIVFGFAPHNATPILSKFQSYGEVMRGVEGGNWVTLRYRRRLDAERALTLNGKVLDGETMIGVLPVTPRLAEELETFAAQRSIFGGSVWSSTGPTGAGAGAFGGGGGATAVGPTSTGGGYGTSAAAAATAASHDISAGARPLGSTGRRHARNIYATTKDTTFLSALPNWIRSFCLSVLQHLFNW